jgi:predicted NAD/FAD-binding protein
MNNNSKIAIIGSGISGLVCAYFLNKNYQIKLYEKNDYVGGHSNTVEINYDNKKIAVDTGFIVFNHQTYPHLTEFFKLLDVKYQDSKMSFAVKIDKPSLEFAGTNLNGVFAQRKNIFNWQFIKMLRDILKFNKVASEILEKKYDTSYSMSQFLDDLKVGNYFRQYFLLPMASAIWSTPLNKIGNYPAISFVRFFRNHGLLTINDQPQWYTVSNGSRQYVQKVCQEFNDKISLNDEVISIYQNSTKKWIVESKKGQEIFDAVVIASHADDALKFLKHPTDLQNEILGSFSYQKNLAVLHKDQNVMPINKNAWASWIYGCNNSLKNDNSNNLSVSYWMNNLQNIDNSYPLFVTLNPNIEIKKSDIFAQFEYNHPIFDEKAVKAQSQVDQIQGIDNIYFCGAYQSYGFHEDGIASGIRLLNKMNIKTPWQ